MAGNILYQQGLGNALGSALGQGAQAFQERGDFLDQKNYDRAQAAMINKKKDAELLYNHLGSMLTDFGKMQLAGGQDKLSPLQLAQAQDAESKVKKIQGLLTSGKYDEGMKAYEDFQAHMNQVEGPKPSDTSGNPMMAGPGQGVMENGLDTLNNQTNRGNQLLGALALKGTQLDVKGKEIAVDLSAEQLAQVKQTSASTIAALNATNGVQVATAKIFTDLAEFNSTAQKAAYLKTISESGAAGAALVDGLNLPPSLAAAVKKQAENVQTVQDATAENATLTNDLARFNLSDLKEKAPLVYTGMSLANSLSMGQLDLQKANLAQMAKDLELADQQLTQNAALFPDQKDMLHQQLESARVQVQIAQATKDSGIAATVAQNYGTIAEFGDTKVFDDLGNTPKTGPDGKPVLGPDGKPEMVLSPQMVQMYKNLADSKKRERDARVKLAESQARSGVVAANVAEKTEGDQVLGVHYQTNLLGTNAAAARNDLSYQDRNNQLGVQMKRAALVGQNNENTISGEQARTAGPLADAQLQIAQGQGKTAFSAGMHAYALDDAAVKNAQGQAAQSTAAGQVAGATVQTDIDRKKVDLTRARYETDSAGYLRDYDKASLQDKIEGSHVGLQAQRAQLTTLLADAEVAHGTIGPRISAMYLANRSTAASISQANQQILAMKQAYVQAGLKNPKELAAMDAALAMTRAQLGNLLSSDGVTGRDRTTALTTLQTNVGQAHKAHLSELATFLKANNLTGKIAVDQFDPTNFTKIYPSLKPDAAAGLKAIEEKLAQDDADSKYVNQELRKTLEGGGATTGTGKPSVTGSGTGRVMTAPSGFKPQSDSVAAKVGINPAGLYAFLGAESAFGSNVKNYKGMDYVGVGQIGQDAQDDVNRTYGLQLNRNVPEDNMELAARYYKILSQRLKTQDPAMIYAAYNWGIGNVTKHLAANGGKLNMDKLPAETQTGIANVQAAYRGYGKDGAPAPKTGADQTTTQPAMPKTPAGKGGYNSSGGGHYTSAILQPGQWQRLDKEGFFQKAAAADKAGPDAVRNLILQMGSRLYGPAPTKAQLNDLGSIVDQIGGH